MTRRPTRYPGSPRIVDGVWITPFPWETKTQARHRGPMPKSGGHRWHTQSAFHGPDQWAAVRPQLTDELRQACIVLCEREATPHRGFPVAPERLLEDLAPVVHEEQNGTRRKVQALLDRLVELRILRLSGSRSNKLDVPYPGALLQLLRDPPRHGPTLGPPLARKSPG